MQQRQIDNDGLKRKYKGIGSNNYVQHDITKMKIPRSDQEVSLFRRLKHVQREKVQEEEASKLNSRDDDYEREESLPFDEPESEINVASFIKEDSAMN